MVASTRADVRSAPSRPAGTEQRHTRTAAATRDAAAALVRAATTTAETFTPEFVGRCVAARALPEALGNPAFPVSLRRRTLARLTRRLLESGNRPDGVDEAIAHGLEAFARSGDMPVGSAATRAIARFALDRRRPACRAQGQALEVLLLIPALSADAIRRLVLGQKDRLRAIVADRVEFYARALRQPAMPLALARRILLRTEAVSVPLVAAAAENRAVLADAELGAIVLAAARAQHAHAILTTIGRHATGVTFRALVRDLVAHSPEQAIELFTQASDTQMRALTPVDLKPLLASSDHAIRMAGATALARVGR